MNAPAHRVPALAPSKAGRASRLHGTSPGAILGTPGPWRERVWIFLAGSLIVGYLSLGRSFAYVGFPPAKLFIGELVLGSFLLLRARTFIERWAAPLVAPSSLSGVVWALFLFLGYGAFAVISGVLQGYPALTAVQNFAFHYYALYVFLGLWIGERDPRFAARIVRILAWVHGVYGVAYIVGLNGLPLRIPGTLVSVFGQPGGSVIVLLGLLTFERNLAKAWPLLLLNGFVLLGIQVRAQWLAFAAGLLVFGVLSRRLGRLAVGGLAVLTLLCLMYVVDFEMPAPEGRGGTISVRAIAGRALASVDARLAAEYVEGAEVYASTVSWRTDWWRGIWKGVHEEPIRALIGYGYGFPLTTLSPHALGATDIRTPHNVFFFVLGHGGWLGVTAFVTLLVALLGAIWHGYRKHGQLFGIVMVVAGVTQALFENFFEAPFAAIPFFILAGLAVAQGSTRPAGVPEGPRSAELAPRAHSRRL